MGGALAKHINKKITEICIDTISKTVSTQDILVDNTINLHIVTKKPVNITGNNFLNNVSINISAFLKSVKESDISTAITENIKNNSELIDEGLVSALSSNKVEILNDLQTAIKNRIESITESNLKSEVKNRLNLIIESEEIVTVSNNSIVNNIEILSSIIINSEDVTKSISSLSSELANTSSITVKNALAILVDSLSGLISAPLLAILGILVACGILFLIFNKKLKDFLFGWMFKKKK